MGVVVAGPDGGRSGNVVIWVAVAGPGGGGSGGAWGKEWQGWKVVRVAG